MSSVPTKQLTELYARIMNNPGKIIKSNTYDALYDDNVHEIVLWHYGTCIFRYSFGTESWKTGGYSASDRDAINSMFRCVGESSHAYINDGCLYCDAPETEFKSRMYVTGEVN